MKVYSFVVIVATCREQMHTLPAVAVAASMILFLQKFQCHCQALVHWWAVVGHNLNRLIIPT